MGLGFLLRILGPLVIALGLFAWGYSAGGASRQRDWDLATAAQVKAQLAATEQARATERELQARLNEAQRNGQLEKDKAARVIAGLRVERDSLRDSITNFTSHRTDDSEQTYRERCTTTGSLLQEALRVSEACAIEGEQVASDLRAVLMAWPR